MKTLGFEIEENAKNTKSWIMEEIQYPISNSNVEGNYITENNETEDIVYGHFFG